MQTTKDRLGGVVISYKLIFYYHEGNGIEQEFHVSFGYKIILLVSSLKFLRVLRGLGDFP